MKIEYLTEEHVSAIYEKIKINLIEERRRQGLSVIELEKRCGIDRTAIYKMESGKRKFGFENLVKICYGLNIKLSDLYEEKTENVIKQFLKNQIDLMSIDDCRKLYEILENLNIGNFEENKRCCSIPSVIVEEIL